MIRQRLNNLECFFIIGRGRSGTTLLQSMLDAHPEVAVPIESRYFIHLYTKYHSKKGYTESEIERFLDDLFTEIKINFWGIDRNDLKSEMLKIATDADYGDLCKCIGLSYNKAYSQSSIKLLGDKNPMNTLFLHRINRTFPQAKYIHLIRDYRDNSLSHRNTFQENKLRVQGLMWNHFVTISENFGKEVPNRFMRVFYEELVREPEKVMKEVCDFLGIAYSSEILEFHKEGKERHKALEPLIEKIHPTLFKPVNESAVQKWKTELTDKEIQDLDNICQPVAFPLGYSPDKDVGRGFHPVSRFRNFAQLSLVKVIYSVSFSLRMQLIKLLSYIFSSPVNEFIKSQDSPSN